MLFSVLSVYVCVCVRERKCECAAGDEGGGHVIKKTRLVPVVVLECGDVKLEQSYGFLSQSHLHILFNC